MNKYETYFRQLSANYTDEWLIYIAIFDVFIVPAMWWKICHLQFLGVLGITNEKTWLKSWGNCESEACLQNINFKIWPIWSDLSQNTSWRNNGVKRPS